MTGTSRSPPLHRRPRRCRHPDTTCPGPGSTSLGRTGSAGRRSAADAADAGYGTGATRHPTRRRDHRRGARRTPRAAPASRTRTRAAACRNCTGGSVTGLAPTETWPHRPRPGPAPGRAWPRRSCCRCVPSPPDTAHESPIRHPNPHRTNAKANQQLRTVQRNFPRCANTPPTRPVAGGGHRPGHLVELVGPWVTQMGNVDRRLADAITTPLRRRHATLTPDRTYPSPQTCSTRRRARSAPSHRTRSPGSAPADPTSLDQPCGDRPRRDA